MIKKISLTGGIGSGKSTVKNLLQKLGYCVWDADIFATEAMASPKIIGQIKTLLGQDAYQPSGLLNRDFVRNKVFSNRDLRLELENILHPEIQSIFANKIDVLESNNVSCWVFYEASLIFEKKLQNRFDKNVLITSDVEIRSKRVHNAKNLSPDSINQIISQQMSEQEKMQFADFIIENNGDLEQLEQRVNDLILFLKNNLD